MKKILILTIFLSSLFFHQQLIFGAVSITTDEVIVHQLVDNSCNENDLCEADLNETIYTCPHDCHQGNGDPAIWQANAEAPPIEIYNIKISVVDGVTIISWETNKPTNAILVLEHGVGGTEGGYLDELFTTHHTVKIEGLDPNKDYYFKIFAKGIYGDDNFQTAQLYLITPTKEAIPAITDEGEDPLEPDQILLTPDPKGSSVYIIKVVDDDLGRGAKIIPPEDNLPVEQEVITDSSSSFVNFFNKVFRDTWFLQILILSGVIFFTYLNFRK